MRPPNKQRFDVASYLSVGARTYQEDALATEFAKSADFGIAVLSDGMGGHAAGDIASQLIVNEVFEQLVHESKDLQMFSHRVQEVLCDAANRANQALRAHTVEHPERDGMGATLVATIMLHNLLYWVSIGDSPLYLFRDGKLRQLNEDHSMAPQIDFLVAKGLMDPEVARTHPDRSCLTSVVAGGNIDFVDCPADPFRVDPGDIVVLSSDGLQYLSDHQIETVLLGVGTVSAQDLAAALGAALDELDHPEQDNASFTIMQVCDPQSAAEGIDEMTESLSGNNSARRTSRGLSDDQSQNHANGG